MRWGSMVEDSPLVHVTLPSALREYARGRDSVDVSAATLAEVIGHLAAEFPGLGYRILDDQGRLRRFVNAYVNDESVSHLTPQDVRLREGDTVHILPSVAGG
jgi:molybdopterin converting factor small subunit